MRFIGAAAVLVLAITVGTLVLQNGVRPQTPPPSGAPAENPSTPSQQPSARPTPVQPSTPPASAQPSPGPTSGTTAAPRPVPGRQADDVASSAPPPSAPPVSPKPSDVDNNRAAIERLLASYVAALNRMDEEAVRAIDPGFAAFPTPSGTPFQATVSEVAIALAQNGQSATLRARVNFTGTGGRPLSPSRNLLWSLRWNGRTWTVVP